MIPGSTTDSELSKDAVLAELAAIMTDRRFAAAERNASFLRYVVEETLEGRANEIKEIVIASDVYGRAGNYDPKSDSIVRVEATRIRQKLRSYYENEGRSARVRIHLPSGSYVPRFEVVAAAPPEAREPAPDPLPPATNRRWMGWAAAGATVIVVLSFGLAKASRAVEDHEPNSEAVAAWQEGVALLNQDPHVGGARRGAPATLLRAIERLEFAVAKDPMMAPAWATLAEAYDYAFAYAGRDRSEDARRAETAARRAVALDGELAAGHHMLGLVLLMMKWDFPAAERSYRRALDLDPRNIYAAIEYADLLRETGRTEQAADLIRRTRALLPALPQLATKEAEIQLEVGRPDAAIATAKAALDLRRDYLRAHVVIGSAYEVKGDVKAAQAHYEQVLAVEPDDRRALPAYGYLLARNGQRERARGIARQLERLNATVRNCAFQVAVVYAGLGEDDLALAWLERAWRTRQVHFPFAVVESRFYGLRNHPRFRELVGRAGLKAAA
jgi:tetratricopeptide (TPR) repeat protein